MLRPNGSLVVMDGPPAHIPYSPCPWTLNYFPHFIVHTNYLFQISWQHGLVTANQSLDDIQKWKQTLSVTCIPVLIWNHITVWGNHCFWSALIMVKRVLALKQAIYFYLKQPCSSKQYPRRSVPVPFLKWYLNTKYRYPAFLKILCEVTYNKKVFPLLDIRSEAWLTCIANSFAPLLHLKWLHDLSAPFLPVSS